jgi:hypothetical protein
MGTLLHTFQTQAALSWILGVSVASSQDSKHQSDSTSSGFATQPETEVRQPAGFTYPSQTMIRVCLGKIREVPFRTRVGMPGRMSCLQMNKIATNFPFSVGFVIYVEKRSYSVLWLFNDSARCEVPEKQKKHRLSGDAPLMVTQCSPLSGYEDSTPVEWDVHIYEAPDRFLCALGS